MHTDSPRPTALTKTFIVRRPAGWMILIFVACLIPRLWLLWHIDSTQPDASIFVWMAQGVDASDVSSAQRFVQHPLYPAMLAGVHRMLGPWLSEGLDGWLQAGHIVSTLSAALAMAAVYLLGVWTFDRAAGLIGMLLFGLSPLFLRNSMQVLSDTSAVALGAVSVVAAVGAWRSLPRSTIRAALWSLVAGLACGLGYLVRPEIIGVGLAALIVLLVPHRRVKPPVRRRLLSAGVLLAVAASCALPYAISIGGLTRKKSMDDLIGMAPTSSPLAMATPAGPSRRPLPVTVLARFATACGPAMISVACFTLITWLVARFIRLPRRISPRPNRAAMTAILVVLGLWLTIGQLLLHGVGYLDARHMLMTTTVVAPLAGAGILIVARWLLVIAPRLSLRPIPPLALAIWLAGVTTPMLIRDFRPLEIGKSYYRHCGLWLAENAGKDDVILSDSYRVRLYAGRPAQDFRANDLVSLEKLIERIDRARPRPAWLVLDRHTLATSLPDLPDLVAKHTRMVEQKVFHGTAPREKGNSLAVYRVPPGGPLRKAPPTSRPGAEDITRP